MRIRKDKERQGNIRREKIIMKINYVICNTMTRFQYRGQMFYHSGTSDKPDDCGVFALQIYDFESEDTVNDITDYKIESTHRVQDDDGIPFDVIVLVNNRLEVKRDLIFKDGSLYLSGIYGININHDEDAYSFINKSC